MAFLAFISEAGQIIPFTTSAADGDQILGDPSSPETLRNYSGFGELLGKKGTSDVSELGFHQTWSSTSSDLRIAGVRPFDPDTGRFLAPDPLGFISSAEINQAVDLFRYAHNNPIGLQDSTGYRGIPVPSRSETTTMVIDGVVMEVLNPESWDNGTIQVANYQAYMTGEKIRAQNEFVMETMAEMFQDFVDTMSAALPTLQALVDSFSEQFDKNETSSEEETMSEAQTTSAGEAAEASASKDSGKSGNILYSGSTGQKMGATQADPRSLPVRAIYIDKNGKQGVLGGHSAHEIRKVAEENGYTLTEFSDALEIEVTATEDRHPIIQFMSGLWNTLTRMPTDIPLEIVSTGLDTRILLVDVLQTHSRGYGTGLEFHSALYKSIEQYLGEGEGIIGTTAHVVYDQTLKSPVNMVASGYEGDWETAGQEAVGTAAAAAVLLGAKSSIPGKGGASAKTSVSSTPGTSTRVGSVTTGSSTQGGVIPVNGRVSVGGGFEGNPSARSNLQPFVENVGGPARGSGVPNVVDGMASQIGELFAPGSIRELISERLTSHTVDWDGFAAGAYRAMAEGGKVKLNVWTGSPQAAQAVADSFRRAGFSNVQVGVGGLPSTMSGAGTMIYATR